MATRAGGRRERPINDESNGMMKTLWADLRGVQLSRAEYDDSAWFENEQQLNAELAASMRMVHNVDPDRRERWKRLYWGN